VARSNEAKKMGIKEGTPYFQLAQHFPGQKIAVFSSNYELYGGMFIQGYQYKKAGVIVMGISPDSPIQQDLFDVNAEQIQKMRRLDEVVDRINRMHGSETIVIGAQQYTKKDGKGKADVFANAIKHDFKSPNPTTRWGDIMKLNANAKKKKE
jgi:DNA polymerase V